MPSLSAAICISIAVARVRLLSAYSFGGYKLSGIGIKWWSGLLFKFMEPRVVTDTKTSRRGFAPAESGLVYEIEAKFDAFSSAYLGKSLLSLPNALACLSLPWIVMRVHRPWPLPINLK